MERTNKARFGIRWKLLAGISAILVILTVLGMIAIFNLANIRSMFGSLTLATAVERNAYLTIAQEKNYLLLADDQYQKSAMDSIGVILQNLDSIDASSSDPQLLAQSKAARAATLQYRDGYNTGVGSLKKNVDAVQTMQKAGDLVGREAETFLQKQVSDYTAAKRTNAKAEVLDQYVQRYILTTNIWARAFTIRMAERDERIFKDRVNYQAMLKDHVVLNGLYADLQKITTDAAGLAAIARAREATDDYFKAAADWIANDDHLNKVILPAMKTQGDQVVKLAMEAAVNNSEGMIRVQEASNLVLIVGMVIAVIIGLLVGLFLANMISKPLGQVTRVANRISEGDLDQERLDLHSSDETGLLAQAFDRMNLALKAKSVLVEKIAAGDLTVDVNLASQDDGLGKALAEMVRSMNEILKQVSQSVDQVSSGAGQVSMASQSLSQGATEQASSLEEITASLNEINGQAKQNMQGAQQVNQLALSAKSGAEAGNLKMKEVVAAMAEINKSADGIKRIAKAIDDISFQINLLALNANVEAARAGKYGKGFAVVADEVRNLAVRSGESVKEATTLVDTAIRNIENGNKIALVTAQQIEDIVGIATKVAEIAAGVTTSSADQSRALDQVNHALGQVDDVTQSNTASSEESASAAEELASQADQLKGMLQRFQLKNA